MTYTLNEGRPYSVNKSTDWVWVTRAREGVARLHQDDCNHLQDNPGWRDRAEAVPADLARLVLNLLPKDHACETSKRAVANRDE
jgi:hypothetical protein